MNIGHESELIAEVAQLHTEIHRLNLANDRLVAEKLRRDGVIGQLAVRVRPDLFATYTRQQIESGLEACTVVDLPSGGVRVSCLGS